MRFPKIPIPGFISRSAGWLKQRLRRAWRWVTMRKSEVVTERDLWFFHTKRIVAILLIFIGLSSLIAITFINMWREGEGMTAVPDVTGMAIVQALGELQDKNLYGTVKTISDTAKPAGIILDQDPKAGFFTREKRSVMLFINQPSKEGEAPNMVGKTPEEARQALAALSGTNYQATLGRIAFGHSETIPAGRIAAQTPAPNAPVRSPFSIDVIVSMGRLHSTIELPDLTGRPFDEAARWLALNRIAVVAGSAGGGAAGQVTAQEPRGGSRVSVGSAVRLTVGGNQSHGVLDFVFPLQLKLSQSTLNFTTAAMTNASEQGLSVDELKLKQQRDEDRLQQELIRDGDRKYPVEIFLVRADGSRAMIFRGEKSPGDHLVQTFTYDQTAEVEMFIGGRKFITRKYR